MGDDDIELPLEIHLCMATDDMIGEGHLLQGMDTPQIPQLEEQLTQEEIIEIKRKYEKKKSTLSMEEMEDYVHGNNLLMDIKIEDMNNNQMERKDSEELYDGNHKPVLVLKRHDTPQSDGTDT